MDSLKNFKKNLVESIKVPSARIAELANDDKLSLTIGADRAATALNNYCSFFLALTAAEKRVLTSTLYGKSFDCYYASQSNLEMYGMRRESTYCFIDFEITLKTIN